jgi:hypothetical protein
VRGKRPSARMTLEATWATSRAARAHYWCAPSRDRRAMCSFALSMRQRPDASSPTGPPGAIKSVFLASAVFLDASSGESISIPNNKEVKF